MNLYNTGTPQEMIDDNDNKTKGCGCALYVLFIALVITICNYL